MKLYCDPISTTSRPVMLFAAEAGIALEREHVDLMSNANRDAPYLAVNPNGIVPYLVDGDFGLGRSQRRRGRRGNLPRLGPAATGGQQQGGDE